SACWCSSPAGTPTDARPPVARQQRQPVGDAGVEVPERPGVEPRGKPGPRAAHDGRRYRPAPMRTTVTDLPESRVRVEAEIPPEEGEPLKFNFEIGVRPTAKLGDYKGLELGRREPEVDPARIDTELEALRERAARLETVEEPAAKGDFVVMD